jgi:hypothetical protein
MFAHRIILAALSFLGACGPAAASLKLVRPRFEQHLDQLARYSLQSGMLITPAVVPLERENYQRYEASVERWSKLDSQVKQRKRTIAQDIASCVDIHRNLLATAEEICYPAEIHLLRMLELSQLSSGPGWRVIWQDYLHKQMNIGTYVDYQICALLWATLFPDRQAQQDLATLLLEHFHDNKKIRCYTQKFLLSVMRDLRDLRDLGGFLFTSQIAIEVEQRLHTCVEAEQAELLMLLLGRVLQIQENNDVDQKIEQEVQHIIQVVLPFAQSNSEAREVVLDIVRYLPARTEQEIIFVLNLAQGTQDADIQQACGNAIRRSRPVSDAAWAILEQGRTLSVAVIREAVKERLEQRQREQRV